MSKRLSTIQIAAINVTAHPHPAGRYLEIFKAAFELKRPIDGGRGLHYVLSSLGESEGSASSDGFSGTIARFTQLDPTAPWFDTTTLDQAGPEQVRRINIPDGLRPNYSSFSFFFSSKKHYFLFETSSGGRHVTPKSVRIFLEHLLNQPEIQSKFGHIAVTLISDESRLAEIYKLHRLKKIRIVISRPNPSDTPESFDKKFSDRLKKQNAQKAATELTASPDASLKPDEETKEMAKLALKDGFVEATGKLESGAPIKLSTRDHARIHAFRYAKAALSEAQAFFAGCRQFLASLT